MKRGDIYWVDLEPAKGHEQRRHRPVVIISSDSFNSITKAPIVLPITNGGNFAAKMGFAVPLQAVKTTGIIRCDQPRALDITARNGRKIETLPDDFMADILARTAAIFR